MKLFEGTIKIEKKNHLIAIYIIFYTFWCKNDYDIPIKSYKMLNITIIIQNYFTEIWAVKDYNICVLLRTHQTAN